MSLKYFEGRLGEYDDGDGEDDGEGAGDVGGNGGGISAALSVVDGVDESLVPESASFFSLVLSSGRSLSSGRLGSAAAASGLDGSISLSSSIMSSAFGKGSGDLLFLLGEEDDDDLSSGDDAVSDGKLSSALGKGSTFLLSFTALDG